MIRKRKHFQISQIQNILVIIIFLWLCFFVSKEIHDNSIQFSTAYCKEYLSNSYFKAIWQKNCQVLYGEIFIKYYIKISPKLKFYENNTLLFRLCTVNSYHTFAKDSNKSRVRRVIEISSQTRSPQINSR